MSRFRCPVYVWPSVTLELRHRAAISTRTAAAAAAAAEAAREHRQKRDGEEHSDGEHLHREVDVLQLLLWVDDDDVVLLSEIPYRLVIQSRGSVPRPLLGHIFGVRFDGWKQLERVVQHSWERVPLPEIMEGDVHPSL